MFASDVTPVTMVAEMKIEIQFDEDSPREHHEHNHHHQDSMDDVADSCFGFMEVIGKAVYNFFDHLFH